MIFVLIIVTISYYKLDHAAFRKSEYWNRQETTSNVYINDMYHIRLILLHPGFPARHLPVSMLQWRQFSGSEHGLEQFDP